MRQTLEEQVAVWALILFFTIGLMLTQRESPSLGLFCEWLQSLATDIHTLSPAPW